MKRTITALALSLAAAPAFAQETVVDWGEILGSEIAAPYDAPEHRAFDFWAGHWQADWQSRADGALDFESDGSFTRQRVFPALDGKVLIELAEPFVVDESEPGGRGFSIRYYIEDEDRWVMAQHWPQPGFAGIALADQLTGSFDHGRIELYSIRPRPNADGSLGLRRYVFSDIHDETFRWDGSNSDDDGATWLTWNVVPFTRLDEPLDLTTAEYDWPNYQFGQLCTEEPHRQLDGLRGAWDGTVTTVDGRTSPATFTAGRLLDGCAVGTVIFEPASGYRLLSMFSYTEALSHWVEFRLDNQPGTRHSYRINGAADARDFTDAPLLTIASRTEQYFASERFDASAGLSRTVIETLTESELVLLDQLRSAPDAEWETMKRYAFSRQE